MSSAWTNETAWYAAWKHDIDNDARMVSMLHCFASLKNTKTSIKCLISLQQEVLIRWTPTVGPSIKQTSFIFLEELSLKLCVNNKLSWYVIKINFTAQQEMQMTQL